MYQMKRRVVAICLAGLGPVFAGCGSGSTEVEIEPVTEESLSPEQREQLQRIRDAQSVVPGGQPMDPAEMLRRNSPPPPDGE